MSYYIFLATGPVIGSLLSKHTFEARSAAAMDFRMPGHLPESPSRLAAFKAHGCIMVLAWLACAPIGMLLARYFRQTWTSDKIMYQCQLLYYDKILVHLEE